MTRVAYLPEEIPAGMTHVGWRCASPDHDCLMPLSRVEQEDADGGCWLYDANHHAHWVPVFARTEDLP